MNTSWVHLKKKQICNTYLLKQWNGMCIIYSILKFREKEKNAKKLSLLEQNQHYVDSRKFYSYIVQQETWNGYYHQGLSYYNMSIVFTNYTNQLFDFGISDFNRKSSLRPWPLAENKNCMKSKRPQVINRLTA